MASKEPLGRTLGADLTGALQGSALARARQAVVETSSVSPVWTRPPRTDVPVSGPAPSMDNLKARTRSAVSHFARRSIPSDRGPVNLFDRRHLGAEVNVLVPEGDVPNHPCQPVGRDAEDVCEIPVGPSSLPSASRADSPSSDWLD